MNRPQIVNQPTTSQHLSYGINLIADLLAPTLGPRGGIVAHRVDTRRTEMLDDSSTVVRRIIGLGSAQKDIGAMVMRSLTGPLFSPIENSLVSQEIKDVSSSMMVRL